MRSYSKTKFNYNLSFRETDSNWFKMSQLVIEIHDKISYQILFVNSK